ncbi:MAG TPA: UDP-glucose/GDP-mannose dehydrogenase family protein [Nocardioidaceae bacterium]|nr:UDP-glucose/GDP-mannose dehydrogenase family protein [Nocardioidaceae bacterium]
MSVRISVIGCGYLGVTHAACMAELGFDVLGVDVDTDRVASLKAGIVPFYEPDLEPLVRKHVESGRLSFTTSYADVADFADVHFVCVATPQRDGDFAADLSYIDQVIHDLAPLLMRPCAVVGKSTVPVGTAEGLAGRLVELAPAGHSVELAWNPEFLREGHAVEDTLRPDRLVFGLADAGQSGRSGRSGRTESVLREVYATPIAAGTPVVVTDYPTAELAKVAANSFLATKISFINAMAELCEATGGDVTMLADAIGHDRRIGRSFLDAGLGFGGGCLPKDIRAFMARAGELGVGEALTFLREVDAINQRRRERIVEIASDLLTRPWPGSRIAVLGAAFKPNSDDIRDSPALNVAGRLHLYGAHVTVHDPQAMDGARRLWPTLCYADSVAEACAGAHVVLVLTEWQEFRELDPYLLADVVDQPAVVDGRNCLNPAKWRAAGWTYRGMGRGA